MKTKILALLVLLCSATMMHAETYHSVKVYTASGEPIYLSLNGSPVTATYTDAAIVVSDGEQSIEYPATKVVSFEFSTIEAGTIAIETPAVQFDLVANSLYVSGLAPQSEASIFTPAGMLVTTGCADASGSFSATDLHAGIYIFVSQSITIKFSVK